MEYIDWDNAIQYHKIPEIIIRRVIDKITDWHALVVKQKLSESFMRKYADKIEWDTASSRQILPEPLIEDYIDKVDLVKIVRYQKYLSDAFMRKHIKQLSISGLVEYQKLTESFIDDFALNVIPMHMILKYQTLSGDYLLTHDIEWDKVPKLQRKLSLDFILKHIELFKNIAIIVRYREVPIEFIEEHWSNDDEYVHNTMVYQTLTEDMLTKHWDVFKNENVYCFQTVSEEFIESHISDADVDDWRYISHVQTLSMKFIIAHLSKLSWIGISGQKLTVPFMREHADELGRDVVAHEQTDLPESFIEEFFDRFDMCDIAQKQKNCSLGFIERHIADLRIDVVCEYQCISGEMINRYFGCGDEIRKNKRIRWTYALIKEGNISRDIDLPAELGERLIDKKVHADIKIRFV
jgi:hypothetical protein